MARNTPQTVTMEEAQARFEEWRRNRQGRKAIPEELWLAAMELARRGGVCRTAFALHLDGTKLRRRMKEAGMIGESPAPAEFVELVAPRGLASGPGLAECMIELEGRQGKLRIHCKGASAADLATLTRALWDAAS